MSSALDSKPAIKPGDIVHGPFASPNKEGTYSKHRVAYVSEVTNGEAKLVYVSASGKSTDGMRFTGELSKDRDGLKKDSFWDASQTTTVSTDFLIRQNVNLPPETIREIQHGIQAEKHAFDESRHTIHRMRESGADAAAGQIAEKTEANHRHVRIDREGNVRVLTAENGWKHHGRVYPESLAEMKRDAVKSGHAPATLDNVKKLDAEPSRLAVKAVAPASDKIQVIKDNGKEAMLGPKAKEQIREAFHGKLTNAGHAGNLPDANEIKKIAISIAGAREGERIAVTAAGTHLLLAKDMPHPPGATVLDAVALRTAAKIAESTLVRGLAGPHVSGVQGVMAAAAFFDNASGRALSASPFGKAVAYIGEESGAFNAAMKVQNAVEPLLVKAGNALSEAAQKSGVTAFVGEQLAKQAALVERLQKATGLDTVLKTVEALATTGKDRLETAIRNNVHGPDNPLRQGYATTTANVPDKASQQDAVRQVQVQMDKGMHEAGNSTFKLTAAEGAVLAKELAKVRPGDQLIVEKVGDIYLSLAQPGQKPADAPKSAVVFDADALRENAGIIRATEMGKQERPVQESSSNQPDMSPTM
jgi:hypothetical protein